MLGEDFFAHFAERRPADGYDRVGCGLAHQVSRLACQENLDFVAGVGHERDDETIARTVIGMAHSLGLFVVAEGVETADQVEFLRRENCEMAQGHFYSPALPAAGCERYLRAWADLVNAG